MSQSGNEVSEEESAELQSGSVYDFLYCDERRIGSFLSQFDELGIPTRVSVTESVQKARGRAFKFGASGGLAGLGNASINLERGPVTQGGQKGEQRDYDPFWANALALLDYLASNDLIYRELTAARIGQFVLATGALAIIDLTLFKGMYSLPAIRNAILASTGIGSPSVPEHSGNRQHRRATRDRTPALRSHEAAQETALDGGLALIGMLPHTIQARLMTAGTNMTLWASLRDDGMMVSASDLTLKHGVSVAGQWNMLGVLDAFPDMDAEGNITPSGVEGIASASSLSDSPFGQMLDAMMPHIRPMLGRPYHAHGMTPLLVFREISG
jgi:hypothetical protein